MRKRTGLWVTLTVWVGTIVCSASNPREWTEKGTDRKIKGVARRLDHENKKLEIGLPGGRTVWVPLEKLSAEDHKFLKTWIEEYDYLSARLIGTKKGRKNVRVAAESRGRTLVVKAYEYPGHSKPIVKKLPPYTRQEFTFWGRKDYVVKAWVGKTLVDAEGALVKTGISER